MLTTQQKIEKLKLLYERVKDQYNQCDTLFNGGLGLCAHYKKIAGNTVLNVLCLDIPELETKRTTEGTASFWFHNNIERIDAINKTIKQLERRLIFEKIILFLTNK